MIGLLAHYIYLSAFVHMHFQAYLSWAFENVIELNNFPHNLIYVCCHFGFLFNILLKASDLKRNSFHGAVR